MRLLLPAFLILVLSGAARAENAGDCRAIAADAERLACFDAAAAADGWGYLPELLGDPDRIDDYPLLGNAEAVQAMLPGRWQIAPWSAVRGLAPERLLQQCDKRHYEIARSPGDGFAFAVTQHDGKGGSFAMWEVRWTLGNSFAHTSNLEGTLAAYRLDIEQLGLQPAAQFFRRAVTVWTYLRLSDDRLLLIGDDAGEPLVMLRCPAG